VQPELYKKELVRQESAESSSTTDMEYAGKLHFALRYDKEIEGLVVKVSITQHLFMITNFYYDKKKKYTFNVFLFFIIFSFFLQAI